jgi:hypothetical protein
MMTLSDVAMGCRLNRPARSDGTMTPTEAR